MQGNKFKLNADKTYFMVKGTAERLQKVENLNVVMDIDVLQESEEQS